MSFQDRRLGLPALALLILFAAAPLQASWTVNGNPACTATGMQQYPILTPFLGGAVMLWGDLRAGNTDIYAQYMTISGTAAWGAEGIPICTDPAAQDKLRLVYHSFGLARTWYFTAVWEDTRNGFGNKDIYAQIFNNGGTPVFAVNGVQISTGTNDDVTPYLASSGNGRSYIVWTRYIGTTTDIYAQQITNSNAAVWGAGGIAICNATNVQGAGGVIADANGAIFVWTDNRSGAGNDIYAQRVDVNGNAQWTANGVPVCTAPSFQSGVQMVSDGAGGAVIMWLDNRNSQFETDIYAQRIDASGNILWGATGEPVVVGAGIEQAARMISDGAGGAFIVWSDPRGAQQPDIYAQRMSSAGVPWAANGIPVCTANFPQLEPDLASDGADGIVVTWQDLRFQTQPDLYAQRLNGAGVRYWPVDGKVVCDQTNPQFSPRIVPDARNGCVLAWEDRRNGASNADIYAVRIENELGNTGYPDPTITSVQDVTPDQGGHVTVNWTPGDGTFLYFDVYRALLPGAAAVSGQAAEGILDGSDLSPLAGCTNGYLWQHMGTQTFNGSPSYAFDVPTPSDSTGANPAINYFMVVGVKSGGDFFNSCVAEGYSVDNLAPPAPALTAQRNGGPVDLSYSCAAGDIASFSIYRSASPAVPTTPGYLVGTTAATTFHDGGAPAGTLYYVVTATDVHGNVGDPSNEAGVDVLTGVGDTPRLTELTLRANVPNPFGAETLLRIGSPAAGDGTLEVYDVAGRRVHSARMALREGWQDVRFDGRDDAGRSLASGVYFYRVSSGLQTRSGKMVIQR